mmetsp:Transcript_31005/g.71616  ORF Transcript_31005/g.71616 Transcript_31005/m.71616 type:complete len:274 (-) Transcript_31005:448-1269(-)
MPSWRAASLAAATFRASRSRRCAAAVFGTRTFCRVSSRLAFNCRARLARAADDALSSSVGPRIRSMFPSSRDRQPATDFDAVAPAASTRPARRRSSWSRAPPPPSGVALASASAAACALLASACNVLAFSTSISAAARSVSSSACKDLAMTSSRAGLALSRTFAVAFSEAAFAEWLLFSSEAQFDMVSSVLPFSFRCFPSMKSKQALTAFVADWPMASKASATRMSSSESLGASTFCASASAISTSTSATSISFRSSAWRLWAARSASSLSRC